MSKTTFKVFMKLIKKFYSIKMDAIFFERYRLFSAPGMGVDDNLKVIHNDS